MALTFTNRTPSFVELRVRQGSLRGRFLVQGRGALTLRPDHRYCVRATVVRAEATYEVPLDLASGTAAVLAFRRAGEGAAPFELAAAEPTRPHVVEFENATPERIAFTLTRACPLLAGVVLADVQWRSHALSTLEDYEITALVDGYATGAVRLTTLDVSLETSLDGDRYPRLVRV